VPPIVVGQTAPTRFCCILGMGSPVFSLLMLKADILEDLESPYCGAMS
jgi:hypothetical protein